jgi:hypothetical protein
MEQAVADNFVRNYFHSLFIDKDIDSLDTYLDKEYWDDDIGSAGVDHIQNSKDFLRTLFIEDPTRGVEVKNVITLDDTITCYLYWYTMADEVKTIVRKGVVIFEMRGARIRKRHTYTYWKA